MKDGTKIILIVTPYFPPLGGGLEKYAFEIASRLSKSHNWRVVFVSSGKQGGMYEKKEINGFTVYNLGYKLKFSNTPFSFSWFSKAKKILKEESPDVINIHTPVPGIGNVFSFCAGKIPTVVTYHSVSMLKKNLVTDAPIWLYEHLLLPMLLNKASYIICSSDFVRTKFLKRYMYKSTTINPGTDTDLFTPVSSKKSKDPTILFVAGLGQAEKFKGLGTLLNAIKILHSDMPNIRLVVVGDGDMRTEYIQEVSRLNLENSVEFKGRLGGKELVDEFQKAHVFALPTKIDSFPTVIVEAMSCGLPVVSTKVGGIPGLVEDGNTGFLIEPDDPTSLADALRKIVLSKKLQEEFGLRARELAVEKYNWKNRAFEYNQVVEQVLSAKPVIVQLTAYYPPHIGGVEVVAQEISKELASRRYPVLVISSDIGNTRYSDSDSSLNYSVERLKSIEVAHVPLMWSLPVRLLNLPKKSIIHAHATQAGISEIALVMSKLKHFVFIAHFHLDIGPSGSLGFLLPFYKKYIFGYTLRHADKVVALSDEQGHFLQKEYGLAKEKILVIPNGVGESFFVGQPKQTFNSVLKVLYVGRLSVQKRVDRFIEALPFITGKIQFTIVGDGEDRQKLEELVKRLGLTNVTFVGSKYGKELISFYRNADLLVMPSDSEGMPLVLLEAMASGLPVVGSNVPGIREYLEGAGVLVDNPSPQSFAREVNSLLENTEILAEFSKKALVRAYDFSWGRLVDRLEDSYQEEQRKKHENN